MDDAKRQEDAIRAAQVECESRARIAAEKVMFARIEPCQDTPMVPKGRIAPCDTFTGRSKEQQAKIDALKKLYGM
jgi:hypothetical protein